MLKNFSLVLSLTGLLACPIAIAQTANASTSPTPPQRATGLWKVTGSLIEGTSHTCISQAKDNLIKHETWRNFDSQCVINSENKQAKKYTLTATCQEDVQFTTVFAGDFQKKYTVTTKLQFLSDDAAKPATMVLKGEWISAACPPDIAPGVQKHSDGKKTKSVYEEFDVASVTAKADSGDAKAQYDLALLYASGDGVAENKDKAAHYLQLAANQNLKEAQMELSAFYLQGIGGLQQDYEMAFKWALKAAQQGHHYASVVMANFYEKGIGVASNDEQAFYWANKMAKVGDINAINNLARYYEEGIGVKKDFKTAIIFYTKVTKQNESKLLALLAKERINDLKKQLKNS